MLGEMGWFVRSSKKAKGFVGEQTVDCKGLVLVASPSSPTLTLAFDSSR